MQTKKDTLINSNGSSLHDLSATGGENLGIELPAHETYSSNANGISYEGGKLEDGDDSNLFDSDLDTDSDYDASSDTELLDNLRRKKYSNYWSHLCKCLEACVGAVCLVALARKVKQRVTECVGVLMLCVACLWGCRGLQCKHLSVKTTLSMKWRSAARGVFRVLLLLRSRKVSISISLYGTSAFLTIILTEVEKSFHFTPIPPQARVYHVYLLIKMGTVITPLFFLYFLY